MNELNPFTTLQLIAGGYCLPRCPHVVADLGVADVLGEDPMTAAELAAAELAAAVGAHPDALARVMRLLSTLGVFESRDGKFLHSPASRLLRADHPQSMRPFVRMFGVRFNWETYSELGHSVRTGLPAGDKVTPGGFWAYFSDRPEEGASSTRRWRRRRTGPVIWTCRETDIENLHFDTRQYNYIAWNNADDLKDKLINRIEGDSTKQNKTDGR